MISNNKSKILFLFFIIQLIKTDSDEEKDVAVVNCIPLLPESYGLYSSETPESTIIEMCPLISVSCCRKLSQIEIYQNWIISAELQNLKIKMDYFKGIYQRTFEVLGEAYKRAEILVDRMKFRKKGNCKIMAERIVSFRIEEVSFKLMHLIDKMYTFFETSFAAFYCTICDAQKNVNIDAESKKIHFDNFFCRQMIENTLPVLSYLHVNFYPFFNLVSKFLNSCDYEGEFSDEYLSAKYKFQLNMSNHDMIENCKENRLSPGWFSSCVPICKKFHPVSLDKFFYPELIKFVNFTYFVNEKLREINKQEKENGIIEKVEIKVFPQKTKKEIKSELKVLNQYLDPFVIKSGTGSAIIDEYQVEFHSDPNEIGINFYMIGSNSDIAVDLYNKFLTMKDDKNDEEEDAEERLDIIGVMRACFFFSFFFLI